MSDGYTDRIEINPLRDPHRLYRDDRWGTETGYREPRAPHGGYVEPGSRFDSDTIDERGTPYTVETLTDQTAATMHDDRQRKKHQRAMIQWAISVAMGIAVLVGVLTKGQQGVLQTILHGFSSPH